jgi:SAM-dependent methyltransferase
MKARRLYPKLWDTSYLHLKDLRKGISRFAQDTQGILVDYGAGTKPYQELFKNITTYIGADFNVEGPLDVKITDNYNVPLPGSYADCVLSTQVLEHIADPNLYIKECHRLLKPDGKLILSTHGTWPYHPGPHNEDYWRWTRVGLTKLLQDNGFEVDKIDGLTHGTRALGQILLTLRDPSRHHRSAFWVSVKKVLCFISNVFFEGLYSLRRTRDKDLDIIPICYVLLAHKVESPWKFRLKLEDKNLVAE